MNYIPYEQQDFLIHYGIEGQRWGIRRYQNPDGSLTDAGRKRYGIKDATYDVTKYSRKFGLVGGVADIIRLNKQRKKEAALDVNRPSDKSKDYSLSKNTNMTPEQVKDFNSKLTWEDKKSYEYVDSMTREKWSGSNKSNFSGTIEYSKKGTLGKDEVEFSTRYNAYWSKVEPEIASANANMAFEQYQKEYKKVISTTTEALAKEYYDHASDYDFDFKMTRDDFKKSIKPFSINLISDIENYGNSEIAFDDGGLMHNHVMYVEYNIEKDKAGRPSING